MTIKVSVIVPVYNPGPYIDPCITSLLGQTMSHDELELIFIDDGSTDGTGDRLLALAADHPQMVVIPIPNSGWPGKPRNIGSDRAQGEYVMFVDQDDTLEPESLQRMYDLGSANGADVVLGKVISDFRGVHHNLYREQRPQCDVFSAHLMNSLTPHKMLRTQFLRDTGIRYPEGPRRLEDQLFMTRAYFAASSASIVSDYVCYRYMRRPDGGNAGSKRIEPAGYYGNLREVLDVVDAHTEAGPQRDFFYERFLRTEMLGRLGGRVLIDGPTDYRVSLLHEVRTLMEQRFPQTVDAGLRAALRVRAALTRTGTPVEIAEQSERIIAIRPVLTLTHLDLVNAQHVRIGVEVRLTWGDRPLQLDAASDGGWLLPESVTGPGMTEDQRRIEALQEIEGDVVIRHRQLLDEWFLPTEVAASVENGQLVLRLSAALDPRTAAGGTRLRDGLHDMTVRINVFGLTRNKRLGADRASGLEKPPVLVDGTGAVHRVYYTELGNLSLNVNARPRWLEEALTNSHVVATGRGVEVDLGIGWQKPPAAVALKLQPVTGGSEVTWPLRPVAGRPGVWATSVGRARVRMALGEYAADIVVTSARVKKAAGGSKKPSSSTATSRLTHGFTLDTTVRRRWQRQALVDVRNRLVRRGRRGLDRLLRR